MKLPKREWEVWSQSGQTSRHYTERGAHRQARELNGYVPRGGDLRFIVRHVSEPEPQSDTRRPASTSPMDMYISGGGDLSNPFVAELLASAEQSHRRQQADRARTDR
ncbi:hypothetical protein ABT352_33330 [Streptosporangium sp. NPDC000563]|uniref:hypothetical protein n=1 Tax=Streptosporangium sp. NPDC000563 TaxID=3154366 RepID=UPI00331D1D39